ncbi:hypothetical protein BD408DRAFT_369030, partial [Parasitella parasitica]
MHQDQQSENLNLPMIHIEQKRKDIHGASILISPTTASKLPDPIQPSIFYMEAVLPVQLKSATNTLHFSASSSSHILPPPFSRSFGMSSMLYSSTSESSLVSSSLSTTDDETDKGPSSSLIKKDSKTTKRKQYGCRFCTKKFTRPSSLKIHVYSHTGEKPFHCTYLGCRRKFSVQSNMKRHLRVHPS